MSDNPLFEKYGQTIRDGTIIFSEGDAGDKMFIIQSGGVLISKTIDGRQHKLAELAKGDFFGEMAIVSNIKRSASAISVGATELLAFDRAGFEAMIGKNTKIAMNVIDKLSKRLQNANSQIQQLLRRNQRSLVALNLYNRFMECESAEPILTLDRAIEGIALDLQSPQLVVSELIASFDESGICEIQGNAIRLKNKKRLVAMTEA